MVIPAAIMPGFRTEVAIQNKVERNLLFKTWGGLGDELCAEPTLRYALKMFKGCDISLCAQRPELFAHLKFKRVFDSNIELPVTDNYLCFETIVPPDNITWQFMSHCLVHCVDFTSLCSLRMTLPHLDKELHCPVPKATINKDLYADKCVAIHAGRHWASKTFPVEWWNGVITEIVKMDKVPVLIGAETDDNRGTVQVDNSFCIDLRGKLSVAESISVLQHCRVLVTNDSAPLHMAATGRSWIGFIATCKHPDYITHWRNGQFGWRMQNLGLGGMWDGVDFCPNKDQEVSVEFVDPELLASWLPTPNSVAEWAAEKLRDYE